MHTFGEAVMTAMPSRRLMTAEELARLPDDGRVYELSRGKLICMAPSAWPPSMVAGNLHLEVGAFVRQHKLGICGVSEGGFLLNTDPDVVRAPDVWFVRADRVPAPPAPGGYWPGAPDLAVEVLSPSDRFIDVMRKVRDYLDAGVRLLWVIDPEARTAGIFRPGVSERFIDEDGALDGEDVLPGFSLLLSDVLP